MNQVSALKKTPLRDESKFCQTENSSQKTEKDKSSQRQTIFVTRALTLRI